MIYIVEGEAQIGEQALQQGDAWFIEQGESLSISAASACRFMLCMGSPHGEPILQHGPFVD